MGTCVGTLADLAEAATTYVRFGVVCSWISCSPNASCVSVFVANRGVLTSGSPHWVHYIIPALLDPGDCPAIRGISCCYTSSRWYKRKFAAHPEPDHQTCRLWRVWSSSQDDYQPYQKGRNPISRNHCCELSAPRSCLTGTSCGIGLMVFN
jgi:hypothetical protein